MLTTAAASAFVAITASATSGAAADERRQAPAPEIVDLPTGIRPEGITSGPGTSY